MCIPSDAISLQCWLQTQLRVIRAWRDEAMLSESGEGALFQLLSQHHAWLMRELALIEPANERSSAEASLIGA